jgi:hypothetical protein
MVIALLIGLQILVAGASLIVLTRANELATVSSDQAELARMLRDDGADAAIGSAQAIRFLSLSLSAELSLRQSFHGVARISAAIAFLSMLTAVGMFIVWRQLAETARGGRQTEDKPEQIE